MREMVFALDADAAGQQQWRQLARQAALRGKQVTVLEPEAYGGCKDVNEAWATGVLQLGGCTATKLCGAVPAALREAWLERVAIIVAEGGVPLAEAERLAWQGLQETGPPR
jgi:hypothetical protein